MDKRTESAFMTPLLTVIKALGRTLVEEFRRKMIRLLLSLVTIVVILSIVLTLTIAGALRLADALTIACHVWLNDLFMSDLLSGVTLILIPLVTLFIVRSRLLR